MQYIFDVALVIGLLYWCYIDKKKERHAQQNRIIWKARKEKAEQILDWLFEVRDVEYCYYIEADDSIVYDLNAFTQDECDKIDNIVKNRLRQRIDLPKKNRERMLRQDVEVQKNFYTQYKLKIKYVVLDAMK